MTTDGRAIRWAGQARRLAARSAHRLGRRPAWKLLWPDSEPVPVRFPPGHFYSPLPSATDIAEATPSDRMPSGDREIPGIDLRVAAQQALLARLDVQPPAGPRWAHNDYFDTGDAAIYQAMARHFRPATVVEVGSGWSTGALLDVHTPRSLTLVEPYPERVRQVLRSEDWDRCTVLEARLQDVGPGLFATLRDGDFLFVDSTHVSKLGSDVHRLFFEVLPSLAPGVIVHLHDILFPFEYPAMWIEGGWGWNETYLLRAFLQYNDVFEILLWPDHLRRGGHLRGEYGSIWLRKAR